MVRLPSPKTTGGNGATAAEATGAGGGGGLATDLQGGATEVLRGSLGSEVAREISIGCRAAD